MRFGSYSRTRYMKGWVDRLHERLDLLITLLGIILLIETFCFMFV